MTNTIISYIHTNTSIILINLKCDFGKYLVLNFNTLTSNFIKKFPNLPKIPNGNLGN